MTCKHCGVEIEKNESQFGDLREGTCFTCNYWMDQASAPQDAIIHNGIHRRIGTEEDNGFRGMAGAKFRIVMNDGREIFSTNIWYQGKIPEHMQHLLPDNASIFESA